MAPLYRWTGVEWRLLSEGENTSPTGAFDPNDVAGAAAVGSANYSIPAGAKFVDAVNGSNSNSGTEVAPWATVEHAFQQIASGGTIVLRAGIYHEGKRGDNTIYAGLSCAQTNVTIQNYPNEAVWFDGSSVVTGWVTDGSMWRKDGWTVEFARWPTFSWGENDSTQEGWQFINPNYPCASWPDMVFIDGVPLQQVSTLGSVGTGTFYMDYSNDRIYIGSSPSGKEVRVSDLQTTISAGAAGITMRGFGVRRYAPCMPHAGAVKIYRNNCTIENVMIEHVANIGLTILANNVTARNVTTRYCGNMGIHTNNADDLLLDRVKTEYCNSEHYNYAPAAGGIKVTRQRRTVVRDSVMSDNFAKGFWADESVYDCTVVNCNIQRNEQRGLVVELCGKGIIANCLITESGYNALSVLVSSGYQLWNNTCVNSGGGTSLNGTVFTNTRTIEITDDDRSPMTSGSVGRDTRQPFPDPDGMTWLPQSILMKNCIIGKPGSSEQAPLTIFDYKRNQGTARAASAFGPDFDGNFYSRRAGPGPSWFAIWAAAGAANPTIYFDVSTYKSATGQDVHSTSADGDVITGAYTLQASYETTANANAIGLPSTIAALVYQPSGTKHIGCWR